jgi:hypothetical protein
MRNVAADPARADSRFRVELSPLTAFTSRFGQPKRKFPHPEPEPEIEPKPTHEKPCIQDRFHQKPFLIFFFQLSNCLFTNGKTPNPHLVSFVINAIPVPAHKKQCNILILLVYRKLQVWKNNLKCDPFCY